MAEQKPNPDPKAKRGNRPQRSENMETLIRAERLTQIAFVLPAAVLIGWGIGALLDMWLHQHWIYIVGLVLGAAGGLTEAVRQALKED